MGTDTKLSELSERQLFALRRRLAVPQALAAIASEHVEATRQGEALMVEISRVNLELLRRRLLR
jgi:hypothetical protein